MSPCHAKVIPARRGPSESLNFGKEYVGQKEKCTQTKNSRDVMTA